MRVALLRTSGVETLDALTVDGGSWVRRVPLSHTAVLIEHHAATLLFDTGLGRDIDAQFRADMPWWAAPLFAYQKVVPARDQLDAAGIRVDRILLSHAHWDHASGLVDFPEVPVWAPYEEIAFSRIATPPAAFPSQFRHGVRWRPYSFDPRPFMGFDESLDLFGDGRLVLVPLPGHTPGSVGLFVTLDSGRRLFFSGDTSWRLEGVEGPRQKFFAGRALVDRDPARTLAQLAKIRLLLRSDPRLSVIPAHDARVQAALGYFPHWLE
ncbi:MBL fold metallo-hydrolase [Pseudomonas aeruginosa]|nr:MBL fold metallo-hydrolase [Pseudomonas aeruginosa]GLF39695.1 MBL fold metallo-hydrolase [Pseudomonas aeruginosa]